MGARQASRAPKVTRRRFLLRWHLLAPGGTKNRNRWDEMVSANSANDWKLDVSAVITWPNLSQPIHSTPGDISVFVSVSNIKSTGAPIGIFEKELCWKYSQVGRRCRIVGISDHLPRHWTRFVGCSFGHGAAIGTCWRDGHSRASSRCLSRLLHCWIWFSNFFYKSMIWKIMIHPSMGLNNKYSDHKRMKWKLERNRRFCPPLKCQQSDFYEWRFYAVHFPFLCYIKTALYGLNDQRESLMRISENSAASPRGHDTQPRTRRSKTGRKHGQLQIIA